MDLQNILQDERKKKFLIIGIISLVVIVGAVFIFTKKPTPSTTDQGGQTQLLNDLSQLTPRDGVAQDQNRLVAPMVKVSADVPVVAPGQASVISWSSTNATSCVDGNGNAIRTSGSMSITPTENYTLDVVCTNPKGTTIESITVAVTTTPIITLTASPEEVLKGEQSFISWSTVNTTRCVDAQGKTARLSGGIPVAPDAPYTFKISCTGPNGTAEKSITVGIRKPTDRYAYMFKSKATATSAWQTFTFQTMEGCQTAYSASTAYQKTPCTKVAVDSRTGSIAGSTNSGDTGGPEVLACITITQNLTSGSTDAQTNEEVTALQKFLARKGFLSESITGTFGSATLKAVKAFQEGAGLPSTGIVDAATQAEIKKVSCADAEAAANAATTTNPQTESNTITVGGGNAGPKIILTLEPKTVGRGQQAKLSWDITEATRCTVKNSGVVLATTPSGESAPLEKDAIVNLPADAPLKSYSNIEINGKKSPITFTFRCDGPAGSQDAAINVYWDAKSISITEAPKVTINANPEAIAEASVGATSEVTWMATNATACKISADAYAEIWVEKLSKWVKIYSDSPAVDAEISGTVRVKPGYSGSSIPTHTEQSCTTSYNCGDSGGSCEVCTPVTVGNNTRLSGLPTATITASCSGPVAPSPVVKTLGVTITPTPPPPGCGGWFSCSFGW